MVAKPAKTKGKLPISRHPLFPPMVAVWFAALFGLGSLAIRPTLLESFVLALRLDLVVPAAAPPLGFTFRVLLALVLFVIGGAAGFFLARRIARGSQPKPEGRRFNARTAAPVSVHVEDDDFARLDAARDASPIPANAIPGRRRALAMEEDFSTEYHDLAPLPGGAPQILDLADLGPMGEVEMLEEVADAEPAEGEFAPLVGDAQFDPWKRHAPFEASVAHEGFVAKVEAVETANSHARAFDAPMSESAGLGSAFSAPPAIAPEPDFAQPVETATFAVPPTFVSEPAFTPAVEPVTFAAPAPQQAQQFAPPPAFAAPVQSERPAFAAPLDAIPPAFAAPIPQVHESVYPSELPTFAPPTEAAPPVFTAPEPQVFAAVAPEPVPEPMPEPVIEAAEPLALPTGFGEVSADAAERLVAAPVGSLGVVQLAERLALAISRRRGAPVQDVAGEAPFFQPAAPPVPVAILQPPALVAPPFAAEPEVAIEPDLPETAAPAQFAAPAAPFAAPPIAMPAAFRPLSFDEPDDEHEPLESILPPRRFGLPVEPVQLTQAEPAAPVEGFAVEDTAAHEPAEDDGYASLLGMSASSRPFVRIEEPQAEGDAIEPVVIFPGHDQRAVPAAQPQFAPAAFAPPAADDSVRRFDAPPVPSAPLRVPNAAARPVDAVETERALKAALATLQRMSGAA